MGLPARALARASAPGQEWVFLDSNLITPEGRRKMRQPLSPTKHTQGPHKGPPGPLKLTDMRRLNLKAGPNEPGVAVVVADPFIEAKVIRTKQSVPKTM